TMRRSRYVPHNGCATIRQRRSGIGGDSLRSQLRRQSLNVIQKKAGLPPLRFGGQPLNRHGQETSPNGYGTSAGASYSGLIFAVRMTLAHFSVSLARNLPNSAGGLGGSTNPPRSARRALMAGSEIAKLISSLSRSTTAAGVFFGAPNPSHELAS